MGETIDDALATRCTVPVSLEPFEGEGRTGTVAQEPFEPCTVTARDMDRGIDAEPAGGLPSEHVIGAVALEQTLAVEVTEHTVANRVLGSSQSEAERWVASWNFPQPFRHRILSGRSEGVGRMKIGPDQRPGRIAGPDPSPSPLEPA